MLSVHTIIIAISLATLSPLIAAGPSIDPSDGLVFCDQGDRGISKAFAQHIVNNIDTSKTDFGVPGNDKDFNFGTNCLSTSHTGSQSCCQVAFVNDDGNQGTVTMTSNKKSTGFDALGGKTDGATLKRLATEVLNNCWTVAGDHSGRWAGDGFQVGLSGGTC
ncbi:hypothetical protein GLOTRDRAFT_123775 [Gloeophyllum trabeum ATCC 11539]|uniref:Ecp2 effector protein domain-containing protein n=1 Tax=Gloeophyllum trabeum (strain ATCC 11539 / FP-39264 / Madison 617) TaxID=670483 RepID=S7QL64_GLOTA|nr:uncharacterized protein GLOTRDRAFT_123775 [Gloeophyllum trabeum ATCC 11539]EPQ60017.1 hypothetical protein GLOTRDRAFT_123775 [Gloeophyllum trabeum ATCC 11539]